MKRDAYIIMNYDNEKAYNATQLEAGFILLKNNKRNRSFVKLWQQYSEDERSITDEPSKLGRELKEFVDRRHDQALLSLLSLNETDQILLDNHYVSRFINMHDNNKITSFLQVLHSYLRIYNDNEKLQN
ncbi:MAG: hypothetical protein EOP33_03145 [Rickettsiaceae bacterium]|nr:MAG: hypothetical protein EOP33_03145 [Rickettsiaceae bacterium]